MIERKLCLVTGASSGIGAAIATVYAANGWDLVITARREDRLKALADRIAKQFGTDVQILVDDLSHPRAPRRLINAIERPIDGLVNNAGYAPGSDLLGTAWIDHLAFLQTLLAGPTELAHLVSPGMKERGFGRILNISSMLALVPAAGEGSLYGPAKGYLVKFSEALSAQLAGTGVHVTALCPGFTETEIFEKAGTDDAIKSTIPKQMWQTPEQVAAAGYFACEENRTVAVSGIGNKAQVALFKVLPDSWGRGLMSAIAKRAVQPPNG